MTKLLTCSIVLLLLMWSTHVHAQEIAETAVIDITFSKTSSIIFPSSIISVDRGSRDVLAQKAQGVQNVLQLKAARENFVETNLTVITADGILHQFNVRYAREPDQLAVKIRSKLLVSGEGKQSSDVLFATEITEPEMERYAAAIEASSPAIKMMKDRSHKMNLALQGIYSVDDVMFFRLLISNRSNVNYDIDYLRFYIRDKKKSRRTSSQELLLDPIFIHGNQEKIKSNASNTIIYSLSKFTIPDAKKLNIEVMENHGGRHLKLSIRNKTIVGARALPH
jgi:conjugative transposon TraN protein